MGNDEFVKEATCLERTKHMMDSLNNVAEKTDKFDQALFGEDGRGGMQHEMTNIANSVTNIEEKLNNGIEVNGTLNGAAWAKIIVAVIGTSGLVVIGFLQYVLPYIMRGG